jgi:hypothetical protein
MNGVISVMVGKKKEDPEFQARVARGSGSPFMTSDPKPTAKHRKEETKKDDEEEKKAK